MTSTFKLERGDIVISEMTGRPIMVEGTDKFRQDIRLVLDIDAGLDDVIGQVGDVTSLRVDISQRLTAAFEYYQSVQDSVQRFDRTPNEKLASFLSIHVVPVNNPATGEFDHTTFAWRVDVMSQARQRINLSGLLLR